MPKPHQTADATTFNAFAEDWIQDNVSIADALAVPGVAQLLLEQFNNNIIDAFDKSEGDDDEDDEDEDYAKDKHDDDGSGRLCSCGRKWHQCAARDNHHEHKDR
jgi:hypothetical protein